MFQLGTSDMRKIAWLSGFIPVLQKVEEILWQKSIHCINVFGKKAEETPSRNGIKELQRCGHDPLQQSVMDILWGCQSNFDHKPCAKKCSQCSQWQPDAVGLKIVGGFFLCIGRVPFGPGAHKAIRIDPQEFYTNHIQHHETETDKTKAIRPTKSKIIGHRSQIQSTRLRRFSFLQGGHLNTEHLWMSSVDEEHTDVEIESWTKKLVWISEYVRYRKMSCITRIQCLCM